MYNNLVFLMVVCLWTCTGQKVLQETEASNYYVPGPSEFTYRKKTSFNLNVDSVAEAKYNVLDSVRFFKLFNNTNLERYYSHYTKNFLYSYQDSTDSIKAVTIVFAKDFYNYYLKYLTFSKNGELVDSLDISGFGGDGGSGFIAYGQIINDSIYKRTWINIDNIEDTVTGEWILKRDTLLTKFLLKRNGQINEFKD